MPRRKSLPLPPEGDITSLDTWFPRDGIQLEGVIAAMSSSNEPVSTHASSTVMQKAHALVLTALMDIASLGSDTLSEHDLNAIKDYAAQGYFIGAHAQWILETMRVCYARSEADLQWHRDNPADNPKVNELLDKLMSRRLEALKVVGQAIRSHKPQPSK